MRPIPGGTRAGAGLILAVALACPGCSNAAAPPRRSGDRWTIVYENETWYRERAEPEREFTGVLVRRSAPQGPGARLGLAFALRSGKLELPVYAARAERIFDGVVGTTITARGKLIDSSAAENSGKELWVGRFQAGQ